MRPSLGLKPLLLRFFSFLHRILIFPKDFFFFLAIHTIQIYGLVVPMVFASLHPRTLRFFRWAVGTI